MTVSINQTFIEPCHLGVDIGGSCTKFGVVGPEYQLLFRDRIPTDQTASGDEVIRQIESKCRGIIRQYPVQTIGIGVPGWIDQASGNVTAANLPFHDFPILSYFQERFSLPVYLDNDANCAAYGEATAGIGADSMLMVTLGTGIGGGIVIGGKLYRGTDGNAGEYGHMSIDPHGLPCACGQNGCWEQYASASAFNRMALEAAQKNREGILASLIRENNGFCDGVTIFKAIDQNCPDAIGVFQTYLDYLAFGIRNLIHIFRPHAVVLAGGLSYQGEKLTQPLKERIHTQTEICVSRLRGDAGVIGAALLYQTV